jgi:hypothetical protein
VRRRGVAKDHLKSGSWRLLRPQVGVPGPTEVSYWPLLRPGSGRMPGEQVADELKAGTVARPRKTVQRCQCLPRSSA